MPESAAHARLVRAILEHIDRHFASLTEISVREDSPSALRGERPPVVGGFVPDVYAVNVPTTMTVIGEAKTRHDLETVHSQDQIEAFLRYLSMTAAGVFILSVPLTAGATARRIVNATTAVLGNPSTHVIVLDGRP